MRSFGWGIDAFSASGLPSSQAFFGTSKAPYSVLRESELLTASIPGDAWYDTRTVPAYVALASALLLASHLAYARTRGTPSENKEQAEDITTTPTSSFKDHVARVGGTATFAYRFLRLVCTIALLVLSASFPADRLLAYIAPIVTYAYASALALGSLAGGASVRGLFARHATLVLLATCAVYVHRDIWPLATYTLKPLDEAEGPILWVRLALLFVAGLLVPLCMPRLEIPAGGETVNPEQIASWLSIATFAFIDGIVWKAQKQPHLRPADMPVLADYDRAVPLKEKAFKHMDLFAGAKRRHIIWNLLRVFRKEYFLMVVLMITYGCLTFSAPLGIYNLLSYFETGGEGATIRPWFWVIWLFVGPSLMTVAWNGYLYTSTHNLAQAHTIIVQLLYEHALRIRMKAETPTSAPSRAPSPPAPDSPEDGADTASVSSSENTQTSTTVVQSASSTKDKKAAEETQSSSQHLVGKINNLVTTDLANVTLARDFIILFIVPVQIAITITFLYKIIGWSAFVSLATIIVMLPFPTWIAKKIQQTQQERLKRADGRVQLVSETMTVIRMVKLFGWERRMLDKVDQKREQGKHLIFSMMILNLAKLYNWALMFFYSMISPLITMGTIFMKKTLNASIVFSTMSVFDRLQEYLFMATFELTDAISAKVSADRINDFLHNAELLDEYAPKHPEATFFQPSEDDDRKDKIGFKNATFAWSDDTGGSLTPSKRNFLLKIEGEVLFKKGVVNLIVGPTGAGKTSLLMALLGEMHFIPSVPDSWYNLPRENGVAYAAQESWVLSDTIKNNIIFGAPWDEERYKKVLYQCALERDLQLFDAGDNTEVGEKGLTLSGGQKARITLARAIYSSTEILLLDDILAALDVHTAKWIVDKCLVGDLVKGRTVILVTHNVALTRPIAAYAVALHTDGCVSSHGTTQEVFAHEPELVQEEKEEQAAIEKAEEIVDDSATPEDHAAPKSDGKLIVAEEIETGHLSWSALKLYLSAMSGDHPYIFLLAFLVGILMVQSLFVSITYYLGWWASQYETHDPAEVDPLYYLGFYALIVIVCVLMNVVVVVFFTIAALRASRRLHYRLIESILGSTLRWLDVTPTARVITRCTQDIRSMDDTVSHMFYLFSETTVTMIAKLIAVCLMTPIFLLMGAIVFMMGGFLGQMYIKAQLSVKRESSNAKAPVLGHFSATIAGLTSIRAYGVQERFKNESMSRLDNYMRLARPLYNLNRWVSVRIETLGSILAASLGAFLLWEKSARGSSQTGFALNMAVGFSELILFWVRLGNELEIEGNSLERIGHYLNIEQEPKATEDGKPPAYWPASGSLKVENLCARYSKDGPLVLKNINFEVTSGQRIGVVGRTGSGKSSLTLSLLRCIPTEGAVYYDGLNTSNVNLDALRSSITIIPQMPELLSGTLRENLDPFDQYDDAVLNDALRSAGLFALQSDMDEGRITLDSAIASGGSNLSVGQRQILALARAIVRGSKLLILDEATSAIDYKTDNIIQESLRQNLKNDVTLITIAHRLQTIMDADKILVLDAGRIAEFDSPAELLKKEGGRLKALVDESGDRATLYAMAEGKARV
ncbi:P-loop containing nucleoside triphosphate hydrolase protein [Schizophyllum commune]